MEDARRIWVSLTSVPSVTDDTVLLPSNVAMNTYRSLDGDLLREWPIENEGETRLDA